MEEWAVEKKMETEDLKAKFLEIKDKGWTLRWRLRSCIWGSRDCEDGYRMADY